MSDDDAADSDDAATPNVTVDAALSVVSAFQRLRADGEAIEDALQLARLRQQLLGEGHSPTRMGRFTLLATVGRGGMGTVYEAYDPRLDRKVALKLLRAGDPHASRRLLEEGRALAKLVHPNVVAVHEVDEADGELFVVMEFVRGVNLRAWMHGLEPRCRPWREVVDVFIDVAAGLAAAHGAGIRHGDVKPDNVIAGDDGRVRVVDFGVARGLADASVEARGSGTPPYMAPEQSSGGAVDLRADQYAFGVSLYEVLHRRRATTWPAVYDASVPRWLQRAITRMTAPVADDRFPSMDAVAGALRVGRRGRLRSPVLLAGAAVLGTAIAWGLRGEPEPPCREVAAISDLVVPAALQEHVERLDALARTVCEEEHLPPSERPQHLDLRRACLGAAVATARAAIAEGLDDIPAAAQRFVLDELQNRARCDDASQLRLEASGSAPSIDGLGPIDWAVVASLGEGAAGFTVDARARLARMRATAAPEALAQRAGRLLVAEALIADVDEHEVDLAALEASTWAALANDRMLDAVLGATLLTRSSAARGASDAAQQWFDLAAALLRRAGEPPLTTARLWLAWSWSLAFLGRYDEADAALAHAASLGDADDIDFAFELADARGAIGMLTSQWLAAWQHYAIALALHELRHGTQHPRRFDVLGQLAFAMAGTGDYVRALALVDEQVAALDRDAGPLNIRTLRARRIGCLLRFGDGGPAASEPCLARLADDFAEAGYEAATQEVRWQQGIMLGGLGRYDEAVALLRSVLAQPGERVDRLPVATSLARVLRDAGRPDEGLAELSPRLLDDDHRSGTADEARLMEIDLLFASGRIAAARGALAHATSLAVSRALSFVAWRGLVAAARGERLAAIADLQTGVLMPSYVPEFRGLVAERLAALLAEQDPADPRVRRNAELALEQYEYVPAHAAQAARMRAFIAALPPAPNSPAP